MAWGKTFLNFRSQLPSASKGRLCCPFDQYLCTPVLVLTFSTSSGSSLYSRSSGRFCCMCGVDGWSPSTFLIFETWKTRHIKQYSAKSSLFYALICCVDYQKVSCPCRLFLTSLNRKLLPKNVEEALSLPHWNKAMDEEMEAIEKNKTGEIVPLPHDKRAVGCWRIFAIKYNSNGS